MIKEKNTYKDKKTCSKRTRATKRTTNLWWANRNIRKSNGMIIPQGFKTKLFVSNRTTDKN